jgi:hypothetical protein
MRRLRRILRIVLAAFALLFAIILMEIFAGWRCDLQGQIHSPVAQPPERKALTSGIRDYSRPEDDTLLSYPEWYIVWSYQEKADFQQTRLPSEFPYFRAVRQYWNSYCCITRVMSGKYPFNFGEQVMLVVIGTSFSAEYVLKGLYEKTIGRVSEWTAENQAVAEDEYAYRVAREYADFVHIRPFYEFRFAHHVAGLWRDTPFWGAHWLRKWERKGFLSLDYTLEAFYCWVIEKGTHATYGYEPADTYAWIEGANASLFADFPRMKMVKQAAVDAFIVDIPRYQEFTAIAVQLAQRKVRFVEIAGNTQILVSALTPSDWRYDQSNAKALFSFPVLTRPGVQRTVLVCDVSSLSDVLNELGREGASVEHVYDY